MTATHLARETATLVGTDGRPPVKQVPEGRGLGTRRVNALLRLVELLGVAEQNNAYSGLGDG
jgi:hypothetical protein